jgi:hypothetical protein
VVALRTETKREPANFASSIAMFDWRGFDWLGPYHYQDPAALSKGKSGTHFQVKLDIASTTFLNIRMRYCTLKAQSPTPRKHLGDSRKLIPTPLRSKSMFLFDLAHSRRVPLFGQTRGGLFTSTSCFSILKEHRVQHLYLLPLSNISRKAH